MRALIFKDIMLSLKKDFFIPASYTDANAELTLFGALTLIQDIAAEHAEKMGIGFHDLKEKSGGFWVIAKTKLQFLRTPKLYEDIVLETWPQKPAGIVSTRNYLVTSKGGEPLFCAKNDWVIIDAATHKLMRLTDTCYPKEAEYIDKSALPERYIKMDYNIDAGIGTETDADSFGDGLLGHCRAYLEWISAVMDRYPNLIIENCASGGMRMDYAMLSRHSIQSVSDQESFDVTAVIAAGAPTAVLPEQGAIWTYPVHRNTEHEVAYNMVNALLMRMHLGGEIARLNEKQFAIVKEGIECYKQTRGLIPELIPFYPLGMPKYDSEWICVGFKNDSKAFLKVWRVNSTNECLSIPLDNVKSAEITYSNHGSGIDVQNNQLKVRLPENMSAALIDVKIS